MPRVRISKVWSDRSVPRELGVGASLRLVSVVASMVAAACAGDTEPSPSPAADAASEASQEARDAGPERDASAGGASAGDPPRDAGDAAKPDAAAMDSGSPQLVRDASSPDAGSAPDAGSDAHMSAACGTGAFCADFEDQTGSSLAGAWKSVAPNCSGDGKASIDQSVVHAGQRALRIQSGGGTCNHIFATPSFELEPLRASLWVRFYVRFDTAFSEDHVTFLTLPDAVTQKDLRMGGQKKILMWNRERDDATLPELSPNGVGMSVTPKLRSWQCFEFHLSGTAGTLETFVDGAPVPGLVIDASGTQDIDGQWLRPGPFQSDVRELRLGWESYGSQPMTLWFDDVVIASERPGC